MELPRYTLAVLFVLLLTVSCGPSDKPAADTEPATDTDEVTGETDAPADADKALPETDTVTGDDAGLDGDIVPDGDTKIDDDVTKDSDAAPDVDEIWANADDDGDGIPNGKECAENPCEDTDDDGIADYLDEDTDGDGIPDSVEAPGGIPIDSDSDGTPNFKDTDSDGDGIPDSVECPEQACRDSDEDGTPDYRDTNSDDDGILDSVEAGADPTDPVDSDEDGTPDYRDTDSDDDGIEDKYETAADLDGDEVPNYLDDDSDGDGFSDAIERGTGEKPADSDGDEIYDFLDGDSDGDGLSDKIEHQEGTDPTLKDTDDDGIDDNTEYVLGYDPLDKNSTIPADHFYLILPYNDPAKTRSLEFSTDIRTADVLIIVDLSNSMSGEHANLKTDINGIIIDQVSSALDDAAFGLAKFGPIDMTKSDPLEKTANVYLPVQPMSVDPLLVQGAVTDIAVTPGTYEYIPEVLYQAASGAGTYQRICHPVNSCGTAQGGYEILVDIAPASCPMGHFGGLCFRPGALPIFILMTDEAFTTDFGTWLSNDKFGNPIVDNAPRSMAQVITAMNAVNAKFIGLDSSDGQVAMPYYEQLSIGTDSVDGDGYSFNQVISPDGTGMSQDVVDAVIELTANIAIDVSTLRKHVANTFGVSDTTKFITGISPTEFPNVNPGEKVTFEVTFQNTFHDNTSTETRLFIAKIEVWGSGTKLDTRDCYILVPGKDASTPD